MLICSTANAQLRVIDGKQARQGQVLMLPAYPGHSARRARYTPRMQPAQPTLRANIQAALGTLPGVRLAIVFGSCAAGHPRTDSDLDIAVDAGGPITPAQKIAMIDALAIATGRPVDLVDLHTCGEPVLGQILQHGRLISGSSDRLAELMVHHVIAQRDFAPYRERILAARRNAWIGV